MSDNRCICCGEIIPEGMLACPNCLVVSKRETELKPCPFCGHKAELSHDYTGSGYSYIRCTYCGLKSPTFVKSFDRASDNDAMNYWNRRVKDV